MTEHLHVRQDGHAGRITLTREAALNALTPAMVHGIEDALTRWRHDPAVALVIIDAAGPKAFCAGGDVAALHAAGMAGDYGDARRFWRDEYRVNAMIAGYGKPVVTLMQGFVMGGGVGLGCHASHRIVGETSRIALPECGIGLVPDVGSTLLLARAPGRLGEYLGLTGDRMDAGDAIHAGFADSFVPQDRWAGLVDALCAHGDVGMIATTTLPAPPSKLAAWQAEIDTAFAAPDLSAIGDRPDAVPPAPIAHALDLMGRNAPLSMACTLAIVRAVRDDPSIRTALGLEFRFTHRAMADADFLEGVRALLIDRDRTPRWRHTDWQVPAAEVAALLAPLGPEALHPEDHP
ncbi:enoyl-CoA hydratase [Loktanella fryxellensis]|uniref:3-hydroxyisobutyryl-CoA hydrolase n=1 Tax=Loktanella fryxellensis TaxID=245187 RepID=A0A1H7YRM4_9RHOB|nr:enoyl-CoA hydratase/isomerase family protein [Loktanella fryxellensis]SEM47937.1 enoyl-CoA hydratase [Loktanella fryxellensis]